MANFFHEIEGAQDPELIDLLIEAFQDESGSIYQAGPEEHFLLPGMPGETFENLELVREEVGSWRSEATLVDESVFAKVQQGTMWFLPKSRSPRYFVSMSACSTIIARTNSHLVVAHVSYSEVGSTIGTINFLLSKGMAHGDMSVIASVGSGQDPGFGSKRMVSKEAYVELGIPASNVHTFEHSFELLDEGGVHRNLTQIVVGPNIVFVDSADWRVTKGHWGPKYTRQDYEVDSHIINL